MAKLGEFKCVCGRMAVAHTFKKGDDPAHPEGYCLGFVPKNTEEENKREAAKEAIITAAIALRRGRVPSTIGTPNQLELLDKLCAAVDKIIM